MKVKIILNLSWFLKIFFVYLSKIKKRMKKFLIYISFYVSLATIEVFLILVLTNLFGLVHIETYSLEDNVRAMFQLRQLAIIGLACYILNLGFAFGNLIMNDSTKSK
jgi:hypothetical protein